MKTLDQIAIEENTDKNSLHHGYTQYYSMFFNKYRYDEINILEIGIWTGDSLRMWERFFGIGKIFGVDIEDKSQYNTERTKTFIADQGESAQLINVMNQIPPIDIIVEDGSHQSSHQILTFATLFPLLKPGGYYITEDCLTSYNYTFCKPNQLPFIEYVKSLVGSVQGNGKIDDLCSDKYKAVKKYHNLTADEKSIEWLFTSTGLAIIKKMK